MKLTEIHRVLLVEVLPCLHWRGSDHSIVLYWVIIRCGWVEGRALGSLILEAAPGVRMCSLRKPYYHGKNTILPLQGVWDCIELASSGLPTVFS